MRPKNFKDFCKKMDREKAYENEPQKCDFVGDAARDKTFPTSIHNWAGLKHYLDSISGVCDGAVIGARAVMNDYLKLVKSYTTRTPKKKKELTDGFNEKDKERVRIALRKVWAWSYSRKLCLERAIGPDGFSICEQCKTKAPKVYPDHIKPIGEVDTLIIERMFIPSTQMQALCKKCHGEKTKRDNKKIKEGKDFY